MTGAHSSLAYNVYLLYTVLIHSDIGSRHSSVLHGQWYVSPMYYHLRTVVCHYKIS